MSSGRKAAPEIEFSTAGISTRSDIFRPASMIMCASASTVAAPPMSFFMLQHGALGLEIEPAGVEADALADQRHLGMRRVAPAQVDQPRRARAAARPTAWMSGKFCFEQSSPTMRADFRAVALGERAGGGFELGRPHVVGRRVDEIAGQRDALGDAGQIVAVDAVGQLQPHRLVLAPCDSA